MKFTPNIFLLIMIVFTISNKSFGQKTSDEYWQAVLLAGSYYDNADYKEAAKAYKIAFEMEHPEEFANHRLYAAASNAMIENEEGVKENLYALLPVSSKTDMKRVLVNYFVFDKYKKTEWWKDLKMKMDNRLKDLIAHHKNLRIFKKGRHIEYKAIRVNKEGDTLANTFITMIPDGTGWGDEAATEQSQVIYEYDYTDQDSLEHIKELEEIVKTEFWIKRDTTGVEESEDRVWIHPFRNNEFFKVEIAPFPSVVFPISNETIKKANSTIVIMRNWGTFSPSETDCEYSYIGTETKNYNGIDNLECYKFSALAVNTRYGLSEIEYYFHEDLGFVEMDYKTYDGDRILFEIHEIIMSVD